MSASSVLRPMLNKDKAAVSSFVSDLALMHERAIRLGMLRTGHKLHEAVQLAGFEFADNITDKQHSVVGARKAEARERLRKR